MKKAFSSFSSRRLFLLFFLLMVPQSGRAQETEATNSTRTINYAFATQIGSGIYEVNGQIVQIYKFVLSIRLLSAERRRWGLRLQLPATFGFYNIKLEDVLDTGLSDKVATLAMVPTLELGIQVRENWWLGPTAGVGLAKDFSTGEFSFIYAVGARSLLIFPWRKADIRLGNRLVYSGYTDENIDLVDDFAIFETGLDLRHPLRLKIWDSEINGSIFGVNYLYFISPQVIRQISESLQMRADWEFGITLGTVDPWRILGIRMPRIGVSYRFGSGPKVVRIVIGDPFPIDAPARRGSRNQENHATNF